MPIQDFLDEAKRRTGGGRLSPAQEEVRKFAFGVYHDIKGGHTEQWVKEVSAMLIQDIAPNLSPSDNLKAKTVVEAIAVTVLLELFESGTLITREEHKDETGR